MPSRPELGWSDLAGVRVGLWGIGTEARASLRRLRAFGVEPILVDDQPSEIMAELGKVLATDRGGLDALAACEVVVKSPGISPYRPDAAELDRSGVVVAGGLGLWLYEADRDRVVCVTGTKGKSTTTSIAGHLARGLGQRVFVGGNLGSPPYDPDAPSAVDLWVVETSSYQATDLPVSPPVVAVTSLSPDHLHWHGDVETYYLDKLSLTSQPGARVAVVNGIDPALEARAELLGPGPAWVHPPDPLPPWVAELGLPGAHNAVNALIGQRCLVEAGVAGADDDERLVGLARGFDGLDSRLRTVATVDGVDFVDDSLSTNVLSTIAALRVYAGRPVALLAGGQDRHIDYRHLGEELARRAEPTLLVALPTNGARIIDTVAVAASGASGAGSDAVDGGREAVGVEVDDRALRNAGPGEQWLPDAVARAFAWARQRQGVVLLSPAAASLDHFRDYRHRSEVFGRAMRELAASPPASGSLASS